MVLQFLSWYLVVQLITLITLPLARHVFASLADRGYAFTRLLGIVLVGFLFWLGYSVGLLRNEAGGAWLALLVVAAASLILARGELQALWRGEERLDWRTVLATEGIFLLAFMAWALVRAHDPAADHTEQPMDLMFMNSIWQSPTYPPQDAWLAGYAISYYYFGYWLLTTLGRLAGQPPAIAYNLGQACWFGLLVVTCYGVVYNLLAWDRRTFSVRAYAGGLLAAATVALTGNLQGIMEYLHANGYAVAGLAQWFGVRGFPENIPVTNNWFISAGDWWWWRSSRVIADLSLAGDHIEVIDEFPIFSYLLGDNHPHVMAMPVAVLGIGLALSVYRTVLRSRAEGIARNSASEVQSTRSMGTAEPDANSLSVVRTLLSRTQVGVIVVSLGALIFLNTWDFPPYWLLMMVAVAIGLLTRAEASEGERLRTGRGRWRQAVTAAMAVGGVILLGAVILYLPYLLSAQSQAGGFWPNLFNPTRLPQFLAMFAPILLAVGALLAVAGQRFGLKLTAFLPALALTLGAPAAYLVVSTVLALNTGLGKELLGRMALPDGATHYLPFVIERWSGQPWTLLLCAVLLALTLALIWTRIKLASTEVAANQPADAPALLFALLLAAIGLLLVMAPEFVFLRDNFGTRMNTVFKFYYQGWLLLGLSGAYGVVIAVLGIRKGRPAPALLAIPALMLLGLTLIYPLAGVYSKTGGWNAEEATFDATAYVAAYAPAEAAAARWLTEHAPAGARVIEGRGRSYRSDTSRMSSMTGLPTLLGWDGHESQWRGGAYGSMAAGRPEALTQIYGAATVEQLTELADRWQIDYIYVGPFERSEYGVTPEAEARLSQAFRLAFEDDGVRIYQVRR